MANSSLDLTSLLPERFRDKTLDTLIKNLFNRHVSKTDEVRSQGNIGVINVDDTEVLVQEPTLERQVNQLTPLIYAQHASEKKVYSWPDIVQKMALMGIEHDRIGEWFKSKSYNFVPPIDLDKFCNFNQYYWMGKWLTKEPELPYYEMGLPGAAYLDLPGTAGNYASTPDSPGISITGDIDLRIKVAMDDWTPAAIPSLIDKYNAAGGYTLLVWSDGRLDLRWWDGMVTREMFSSIPTGLSDGEVKWVRATLDVDDGIGNRVARFYTSDDGETWVQLGTTVTIVGTTKIIDGSLSLTIGVRDNIARLAGKVYYAEVRNGIDGPVVTKFEPGRFGSELIATMATGETWTVSQSGTDVAKIEHMIDPKVASTFAQYESTGESPEFYVIKRGDLAGAAAIPCIPNLTSWSDWAYTNLWMHREDAIAFVSKYGGPIGFEDLVQATRPIIEYYDDIRLNTHVSVDGTPNEIGTYNGQPKLRKNQLPLFDVYNAFNQHVGVTSALFYYGESSEFPLDTVLQRRLALDDNGDFVFEHSFVHPETEEILFYKLYDEENMSYYLKTSGVADGSYASTPDSSALDIVKKSYLSLPGTASNLASTPDTAVSVVGDLDVRAKIALDDWTPAAHSGIARHWGFSGSGDRSWDFRVSTSGLLTANFTQDGVTQLNTNSTLHTGFGEGTTHWVRFTRESVTGVVRFYTSEDGNVWTQLGDDRETTPGDLHNSTDVLYVGMSGSGGNFQMTGKMYRFELRNGINGPVVAEFDPTRFSAISGLTATMETGETWTISQSGSPSAQIVDEVSGDIDIRVHVALDNWLPATNQSLVAKWVATGNQRSYSLQLLTTGKLRLQISPDGTAGSLVVLDSPSAIIAADGATLHVRVTLDVDTGDQRTARFYTSVDGVTWGQIGSDVLSVGSFSLFNSTAPLLIGSFQDGVAAVSGKFFSAEVRKGIDGNVAAKFTPQDFHLGSNGSFTSSMTGEVWTLSGTAEIVTEGADQLTVWREGPIVGPRYTKFDTTGTLINQNKLLNFQSFYWTAVDADPATLPAYNQTGLPEYTVIQPGGTSDWSVHNYWSHVTLLDRNRLTSYVQATQPIVEFNLGLESELIATKTAKDEAPRFNHYLFNPVTKDYEVIPGSDAALNDAYLERKLFARISDLDFKDVIETTPEIFNKSVLVNGEHYLQGLATGKFVPEKDGTVYGYKTRVVSFTGVGNGALDSQAVATDCLPEVITLTFNGTSFDVVGSVSGPAALQAELTIPYTISGFTFVPRVGTVAYEIGDQYIIEIKTSIFENDNLYVNLDGSFRTLASPGEILTEIDKRTIIESSPINRDGAWEVPPQLMWNPHYETRMQIKQGDLYSHFISIIESQLDLVGSPSGKNNWRDLPSADVGLGGLIKQHDGQVSRFISLMIQEGITMTTLIEYAKDSYENLFSAVREFLEIRVPDLIVDGNFTPPVESLVTSSYLSLTGAASYANTPSPVVPITGDLDIRVKARMSDWTPDTPQFKSIISKYDTTVAGSTFRVNIQNTGVEFINFIFSDGTSLVQKNSDSHGFVDGEAYWIRVTLDVDDGLGNHVTQFYKSDDYDPATEEGTWVEIGTVTTAGVVSLQDNSTEIRVGAQANDGDFFTGDVFYAEVRNGIDGPAVVSFDASRIVNPSDSIVVAATGETWTLVGSSFVQLTEDDISIDQLLVDEFKEFFSGRSPVVTSSATTLDDNLATLFYDTTSALGNMVATLPYLGLEPKVEPKKEFDLDLNYDVIVHHDGHKTKINPTSPELLKKIVTRRFVRSPGQETPGIINGGAFPDRPYRGQFWYKTTTGQLFIYRVISDFVQPTSAENGDYWYDRPNNALYQYNGDWILLGSDPVDVAMPWTEIKLDLVERNLILALERELYDHCPVVTPVLDAASLENLTTYVPYLKKEFERFGVKNGVIDVYSAVFDPNNAFTWNYFLAIIPTLDLPVSTWQEIYRQVYGTPRPEIQPWISAGYANEATFIAAGISAGAIPIGTPSWSASLWAGAAEFIRAAQVAAGKTEKLSVDTATGALLPPYSLNAEGLIQDVPSSAATQFGFRDNGPVELLWRRTLDYLYAKQKTFFKIDPLNYIENTWGTRILTVGEYTLSGDKLKKLSPSEFLLHGDPLDVVAEKDWIDVSIVTLPLFDVEFVITCVNRQGQIFKVTGTGITTPVFFSGSYTNEFISVTLQPTDRGFMWGDSYTITVDAETDTLEYSVNPQRFYKAEGYNQIYVQYNRNFGEDLDVALNKTLFREWIPILGYRFSGVVDSDTIQLKIASEEIDASSFQTVLKENKYYFSSWINALRVQLVQRGATTRLAGIDVPANSPGDPGDDWIFRVDNYNERRPDISWYELDTDGPFNSFVAIDGKKAPVEWRRYTEHKNVISYKTPFLITGIHNVINFILGYADYLYDQGWRFSEVENPNIDPITKRPINYQLLVEQFIVQQYSGVEAGSGFVFNPFSRKAWFETQHGVVGNLFETLGFEQETVPAILDINRKKLKEGELRVFRQDQLTEVVFDRPVYTFHVLLSEWEHVVLFDNYSVANLLIYDPFLGQRAAQMNLSVIKQPMFTGKLDFGGRFLLNGEMKRNLTSSIDGLRLMYDSMAHSSTPEHRMSLPLLGYSQRSYFKDRESLESTELRFWRGMIANKGTNVAIDAYVNSAKFSTANMDEYWAYKHAEYGDARPKLYPELKVQAEDCLGDRTDFLLLEKKEDLTILQNVQDSLGFYDESQYDVLPYDLAYGLSGSELFDSAGMILVSPDDETRWYRYEDIGSIAYFDLKVITECTITPTDVNQSYVILNPKGQPVRADCFEIVDTIKFNEQPNSYVYYERGDYIIGSNPAEYSAPKFARINSSVIKVTDPDLIGRTLKVVAYGPNSSKYSPAHLYNYKESTLVKSDIILWDPARGVHHPEAHSNVNYEQALDPARYNQTLVSYKSENKDSLRTWGAGEVGKVWWDTKNLEWKPYHDIKIVGDLSARLATWGARADYSSINVYEWVKSTLPPEEYGANEGAGEPAFKNVVYRNRTWWQRPVAWKFSSSPGIVARAFSAYQPAQIKTVTTPIGVATTITDGVGMLVLDGGLKFSDYEIGVGSKIAGAYYSSPASKIDGNLVRIFGLVEITSEAQEVVGRASFTSGSPNFVLGNYLSAMDAELDSQTRALSNNVLGDYNLSTYTTVDRSITVVDTTTTDLSTSITTTEDFRALGVTEGMRISGTGIAVDTYVSSLVSDTSITMSKAATASGAVTISFHADTYFLKLTSAVTGKSQTLEVRDTPVQAASSDVYFFDEHGIKINYTNTFGHGDTWTTIGALPPRGLRIKTIATALGNVAHDVYLREYVEIFQPMQFTDVVEEATYNILDSNAETGTNVGWIAWSDPEVNPATMTPDASFNAYSPIAGDWVEVGNFLGKLYEDINAKIVDPVTWFDGLDYTPYKSTWGDWKMNSDVIVSHWYTPSPGQTLQEFFQAKFIFEDTLAADLISRGTLYVNGTALDSSRLSASTSGDDALVELSDYFVGDIQEGSLITFRFAKVPTTPDDMSFDPDVEDDPFKLVQYKRDFPHVKETRRDEFNGLTINNYYFWAKNKLVPSRTKSLSVKQTADLLEFHNDLYAVTQALKWYDQLDGRPNRHSVISIKNLNRYVKDTDAYKIRLVVDGTLRNDDRDSDLKNRHVEWILLRRSQSHRIPEKLWTLLTDTLCGQNAAGKELPFSLRASYDVRNETTSRYGFDNQQVLVDAPTAKSTVKHTILNTRVTKIENNVLVPDFISYEGFDLNDIDAYLESPTSIRKFMSDLWRLGQAKQVNEIFFEVLEDALAKNPELTQFFKTSYVSLNEVRTIT